MTSESNDREFRSPGDRRSVYRDLRQRNERRMAVARMLEARRLHQIERVMQTARASRPRGRRK